MKPTVILDKSQTGTWLLTLELDLKLAVYELIALQYFSQSTPFVFGLPCISWGAEGKVVIVVCFLGVVIRSNLVYPEPDRLPIFVLCMSKDKP